MATMALAWVVCPLVVATLALGLGLLAARLTRADLSPPALMGVGASALVALATGLTWYPVTVVLAGPALVLGAVAGWVLGWRTLAWDRTRSWSVVAAMGAYACYAAPVLLVGAVSWAGYIKLDDTGTWLAFADRLGSAGYTSDPSSTSTPGVLIRILVGQGYPVGAFADLGVLSRLMSVDAAWLVQPLMATLAAILACILYAATDGLVDSRAWRAAAAFVASQAALLVGYTLWGGLKEITLAVLVASACVLLAPLRGDSLGGAARGALFALPAAAIFAVAGLAAAVYLAPLLLAQVALLWASRGWRSMLQGAGAFVVVAVALGVGPLSSIPAQLETARTTALGGNDDIGNLFGALRPAQLFGVWLSGDFRSPSELPTLVWVLVSIVALAAVGGIVVSVTHGKPAIPALVLVNLLAVTLAWRGAWLAGKAMAVASPALLLAACVAFAVLAETGRRFEGVALIGVVAVGVLVSNVMQYRVVWVAPSDEMRELEAIGASTAPAPALLLDYNPVGARHFLRALDVEGAGELRYHQIPMYSGAGLDKAAYADVDDFPVSSLQPYRTLVLRTSVTASRPPSTYDVLVPGRSYEAWRQNPAAASVLQHFPLGTHDDPAAPAPCDVITQAAARAGPGGRVAVALRAPQVTVPLDGAPLPPGWAAGTSPGSVAVSAPGEVEVPFSVPAAGRYVASYAGSSWGRVGFLLDGKTWYDASGVLTWTGNSTMLPALELAAGAHTLTVQYATGWRPGESYVPSELGPVVLSETAAEVPVTYVPSATATTLCGKRADWIEAVGG